MADGRSRSSETPVGEAALDARSRPGSAGAGGRTRAVVVHFGDPAVTAPLLRSLAEHAPLSEVVIVDNGGLGPLDPSGPRTAIRVLRAERNLGYGAACNLGAAGCDREFLLFLNNDVRLLPGSADRLERALLDAPGAAAAGPRVLDPDGTLVPSIGLSPSPRRVLFENLFLPRVFPGVPFFFGHHTALTSHRRPRAVESLLGAAFLFRRDAFESLGGFDERYPFYGEESDLFRRTRDAGWSVRFEPSAEVIHAGGLASREVDRGELDRMLHTAFLTYANRFHGPRGAARTRRALWLGAGLRWALALLQPGETGRSRRSRYRRILEIHRTLRP